MIAYSFDLADFSQQLNAAGTTLSKIDYDKVLKVCAVLLKNDLKANMKAGRSPDGTAYKPLKFPRPNGTSTPLWDSGALARSLGSGSGHVEKVTGDELIIGTNLEYAALHQYGGTITPKKAKWLAIPLTAKAKRAGSPKDHPEELQFVPLGRNKAGLRSKRQPKGKKKGTGTQKLELEYLLVKKVIIPARPFIGVSPKVEKQIEDVLLTALAA